MTIVASLTTIPSRLPHLEPCLSSILKDQGFEKIILTIPLETLRGNTYPDDIIENLKNKLGERLVVYRIPKDFGPITKLVGCLDIIDDPETIVVVFDDDRELLKPISNLFSRRIEQNPNQVYSLGGWCFGKGYRVHLTNPLDVEVDSIMGTTCIAFRRGLVDKKDLLNFRREDNRLLKLDDMRISGYFSSKRVKRFAVGGDVRSYLKDIEYIGTEKLSTNVRFWMDNKAVIDDLYRQGLFSSETSGGLSLELFVVIAIISFILIGYGLFNIYKKERIGYLTFILGLFTGIVAFFHLRSFML